MSLIYNDMAQAVIATCTHEYLAKAHDSTHNMIKGCLCFNAANSQGFNMYIAQIPAYMLYKTLIRLSKIDRQKFSDQDATSLPLFCAYIILSAQKQYPTINPEDWSHSLSNYALYSDLEGIELLLHYENDFIQYANFNDLNDTLSYLVAGYAYGFISLDRFENILLKFIEIAGIYIDIPLLKDSIMELSAMSQNNAIRSITDHTEIPNLTEKQNEIADYADFFSLLEDKNYANSKEAVTIN